MTAQNTVKIKKRSVQPSVKKMKNNIVALIHCSGTIKRSGLNATLNINLVCPFTFAFSSKQDARLDICSTLQITVTLNKSDVRYWTTAERTIFSAWVCLDVYGALYAPTPPTVSLFSSIFLPRAFTEEEVIF